MNPEEINKTLATLTPTEKIVLMLFCEGLKQKEMAKKLGVSLKAIDFHFSNIYGKLGLDASSMPGKRRERWNIIREHYCQALSEIIQSPPVEDEIRDVIENLEKTLVLKPSSELASPRANYKTLALVREDFSEIEEYKPDKGSGGGGGDGEPKIPWISFLLGVVLTALILVGLWIANQRFHFLPIASATQVSPTLTLGAANDNLTPEATQVPGATSTVEAPTNAPTATRTNIPTETPTIAPTLTPTETASPTISPTPTAIPWFIDDFTDGFDPKWIKLSDDIAIIGGEVTFNGNYGDWMFIPAPDAPNYLIEFKVRFNRTNNWGFMVAPAFIDPSNYYAFRSSWSTHEWVLEKDGRRDSVGDRSLINMEEQSGVVTVQGKNIAININGFDFAAIYNDQIDMGNIGFYIDEETFLDQVKITLLP